MVVILFRFSTRNIRWTKYVLIIIERHSLYVYTQSKELVPFRWVQAGRERRNKNSRCFVLLCLLLTSTTFPPPSRELSFVNSQHWVRWISISFVVRTPIDSPLKTKLVHCSKISRIKSRRGKWLYYSKSDSREFNQRQRFESTFPVSWFCSGHGFKRWIWNHYTYILLLSVSWARVALIKC